MKNKNTYIILLVIFSLICVYNIQYTIRRVSLDADLNEMTAEERTQWLSNTDNALSYKAFIDNSMSLGLDLQGGMYVTLELGVDDMLTSLAGQNADAPFKRAMETARRERETSEENFVDLFFRIYKEQNPNRTLAAYFPPSVTTLSFNAPEATLMQKLREMTQAAMDNSLTILRARIDQFGVASPNIQPQGNGRIIVELPGVKDSRRVRDLLRKTASLEFFNVYTLKEAIPVLVSINDAVKRIEGVAAADSAIDTTRQNDTAAAATAALPDTAAAPADSPAAGGAFADQQTPAAGQGASAQDSVRKANPFFSIVTIPGQTQEGISPEAARTPEVGLVLTQDTAKVNRYLAHPDVQAVLPNDIRFLWTAKPAQENENLYKLIAIRFNPVTNEAPLTGAVVTNTSVNRDQNNRVEITMSMNSEGRRKWGEMTTEAANNGNRPIAVVLDNLVYTYPFVNDPILGGNSSITGSFTVEEAKDLANILRAGQMPAPARVEGEEIVGPTLGAKTVNQGMVSFIGGFISVLLLVWAYYRRVGLIANAALLVNLFFVIGVMSALQVVLTLPGIAGLVLSMAMAVDSNVLIYERMREELRAGKGIKGSITSGFQNAFSAILDGNVTTFLTGLLLFIFGSGPIAGFAVTLMIGIVTTLVSALLVTRLLLEWASNQPNAQESLSKGLVGTKQLFFGANFAFIPDRKKWYLVSGVAVAICMGAMLGIGFRTGVDFDGGRQYVVQFPAEAPNVEQVAYTLAPAFDNLQPSVRTIGTSNQVLITTSFRIREPEADDLVRDLLVQNLAPMGVKPDNVLRETKVGPSVADDIREGAVRAVIFALLAMFLYIFARFGRWQFGLAAILSLAFNVILTLGLFALLGAIAGLPFSVEIDQNIIAALLTIVGYTINDTVVVFDRIREKLRDDKVGEDPEKLFNTAVNETLSRTVITATSTLVTAAILFFFAGDTLKGFMLALFWGIVVGTFSSIYIASPLALDFAKKSLLRDKAVREGEFAAARRGQPRKKVAEEAV